jgi:hypothetical protein
MQSPVSRNSIKLDKMRSSTQMSNDPDEVTPSSSWVSSVRHHFDQFRNKYPRVPGFGRRHRKTGLLEAAKSTRAGKRTAAKLPEAVPDSHLTVNLTDSPQVSPSLWDRAYDALKEKDRLLVEEYETLLSKELSPSSTSDLRFNVVIRVVGSIVPSLSLDSANTT